MEPISEKNWSSVAFDVLKEPRYCCYGRTDDQVHANGPTIIICFLFTR